MKIVFKEGVELHPLHLSSESMHLLEMGLATAPMLYEDTLVVTSAADGEHSMDPLSGHYVGRSWDVRFAGERPGGIFLPGRPTQEELKAGQEGSARAWATRWQRALGAEGVVLLEVGKRHIHAQWGRAPG